LSPRGANYRSMISVLSNVYIGRYFLHSVQDRGEQNGLFAFEQTAEPPFSSS